MRIEHLTHRKGIEDAIVNRRREEYEEKVTANSYDYDAWFDFIRLEETEGLDFDKTRGWNHVLYMDPTQCDHRPITCILSIRL